MFSIGTVFPKYFIVESAAVNPTDTARQLTIKDLVIVLRCG